MDIVSFRKYKSLFNKIFICNTVFIFFTYISAIYFQTWKLLGICIIITIMMLVIVSISRLKASKIIKRNDEYGFNALYPTILKGKDGLIVNVSIVIMIVLFILYIVIDTATDPTREVIGHRMYNVFFAIFLFLFHEMYYIMGITGAGLAVVPSWKHTGDWDDYCEMCIERGLEP